MSTGEFTGDRAAKPRAVSRELTDILQNERRQVLASLTRLTGDLGIAEDAVQDASIRALQTWPGTGIPPNPRAWLIVTGKHRAIDLLRREGSRFAKEREAALMELQQAPDDFPIGVLRDDQLRLIFTCCHPALAAQAQVLEALVAVDALHGLDDYFWLHATRAELLRRLGRESEAAVAATRARGLTDSPAQQRLLEHRHPGRATR